ncbi:MAG TPA: hypothetical protein VH815_01830, partial [Acidobacteriota bacterium]
MKSRIHSERLLWILMLLFVFSISFSIAVSHIFLAAAALVYLYWKIRHNWKLPNLPILVPAMAFAYCTLLSASFSIHPAESFIYSKDLAMFIILPIFFDMVRNLDDVKVIYG